MMTGGVKRLQAAGPLGGWCWVGGLAGGGCAKCHWGSSHPPLETWRLGGSVAGGSLGSPPQRPQNLSAKLDLNLIGRGGGGRKMWSGVFCSLPAIRVEGLVPT